jgi:cobalt-zinc-cadmium efflux system protein
VSAEADRRYLVGALCLIAGFMAFEVVAAVVSGSLVLVADAGHMLTDAGALAGSLWALRLAARPPGGTLTFGLKRAEVLSAQANGVTLVVMALVLAYEAIHRLLAPPPVEGLVLVVVAGVGVGVNLAATWSLARANRDSMNVEGSFQHILTDLYAFLATVVAGLVIFFLHWRWADPVASLVVVALMLRAGWGLLRDSGRVLLQAAPDAVDLEEVRRHMAELPEVVSVHDLHAWTLSSKLPVLSAHVVVNDACLADGSSGRVLDHLQACLADHFDVEHSTFQLEPASHPEHEVPDHR